MLKEEYLQQLMDTLYIKESLEVYDYTAVNFTTKSNEFANTKSWTDQLVRDKLAVYTNSEHTVLQITNFGKFWMMKGGYASFLKEGQSMKDHPKNDDKVNLLHREKEELIEARLRLTHYRLVGFWLALVISSIGFLLSLYNLFLIMNERK